MPDLVYLDYNATAPIRPEAVEAVRAAFAEGGNPSSVHTIGRRAKARMENARERVAAAVGSRAQDVIFTSGATEALHLAIEGSRRAFARVLVSSIEHDAVAAHLPEARRIACRPDGQIDLEDLETALAEGGRALVVMMLANNETGVIQPIERAAAVVRQSAGAMAVDAVQALGRVPIDLQSLDASYLVVSSHKIGGAPGAGALIMAPGAPFAPPRSGGGQERGARPGTESVPAIAGFAAALQTEVETSELRDQFEARLRAAHPDVVIFGQDAPRLPNTSLFALPGLPAERAVIALDLDGVAVSSGAACSSGKVKSSRVLAAMGVSGELAACAVRISFGWASQVADVDRALSSLDALACRRAPMRSALMSAGAT
jgi:cysteine desulfurase